MNGKVGTDVEALRSELAAVALGLRSGLAHEVIAMTDISCILAVLDQLASCRVSFGTVKACVDEIRRRLDPEQRIVVCACCGERHALALEQLDDGVEVSGYRRRLVDLGILKLNDAQRAQYFAIDHRIRMARGVYPISATEGDLYFLHPQFVSRPDGESSPLLQHEAPLCLRCNKAIDSDKVRASVLFLSMTFN